MSEVNIDALAPENITIKYSGQSITISQPSTVDILKLGKYQTKLANFEDLEDSEIESYTKIVTDILQRLIPELAGRQLTLQTLLRIPSLIIDATTPKGEDDDKPKVEATTDPKDQKQSKTQSEQS